MTVFDELESNVRYYCRCFPDLFTQAKGSVVRSESGRAYLDFFCGSGALNYGHNNEFIKQRLLQYIQSDGITHALDAHTSAKRLFLERFNETVLKPRGLDYKIQFCAPGGAAAISAAIKLAIKVTKRPRVLCFMGGYHGLTLDAISTLGDKSLRRWKLNSGIGVDFMPYPGRYTIDLDTIEYLECVLRDDASGIEKPAAILVESIQGEGGVIVATSEWMRRLAELCRVHEILLIYDEIQVGCHRTGPYFSWERADIVPDMVVLSKALSGYGLPMALLLIDPRHDQWEPGEDRGTFRGNQLAFTAASATLELIASTQQSIEVARRAELVEQHLGDRVLGLHDGIGLRGLGMIWGIDLTRLPGEQLGQRVARRCFESGLLVECAGPQSNVLKIMPPLNIDEESLSRGCDIILQSLEGELQAL